jgi:hypothetical protein
MKTMPRSTTVAALPTEVSDTVIATCSYIDSVALQQKLFFRGDAIKYLQQHCGNTYGPTEKATYGGRVIQSLVLHQPEPEALRYIADKACSIVQVDVSLDLLTDSRQDAKALQRFFVRHLMPHRRPSEAIHWIKTTAYFGFNHANHSPGVSVAVYGDRDSKAAGSPCCHIEWKVKGAAPLRARSLRNAAELLVLDHRRFWREALRVVAVPTIESLGSAWTTAHALGKHGGPRKFPFDSRTASIPRVGSLFLRSAVDDSGDLTSTNDLALYLCRHKKAFPGSISSLFDGMDVSSLLPAATNALWPS